MDDSCVQGPIESLQALKGKTWSSMQHLIDTSESDEEINRFSQNNGISSPLKNLVNGEMSRSASADLLGSGETMKLKREDMPMYGQRPAWDPFELAVCEFCGSVIKVQALRRHIELRHQANRKDVINEALADKQMTSKSVKNDFSSGRTIVNANSSSPELYVSSSQPASSTSSMGNSNTGDGSNFSNSSCPPFNTGGESNLKALLSSHTVSIYPLPPPVTTSSPAYGDTSSCSQTEMLDTSRSSSASFGRPNSLPSALRTASPATISNDSHSTCVDSNTPQRRASITSAVAAAAAVRGKLLPCKDRKYDPDRHCGVRVAETDQPCTRSLTCKTHSLTLRRAVCGRSMPFDTLLTQHRLEKEAAMRAAGIEVRPTKQQLRQQQKLQQMQQKEKQQLAPSSGSPNIRANAVPVRSHLLAQLQSPIGATIPTISGGSMLISPVKQVPNVSMAPVPRSTGITLATGKPLAFTPAPASTSITLTDSPTNSGHCSKLLLQKLSGKLTSRAAAAAAAAAAARRTNDVAAEQLFSYDPIGTHCDIDNQPNRESSMYLISKAPQPAAVCSFNARQAALDSNAFSSRLYDRKRDMTYSALGVFRTPLVSATEPQLKIDGFAPPAAALTRPATLCRTPPEAEFETNSSSNSNASCTSNAPPEKCFVNLMFTSAQASSATAYSTAGANLFL